MNGRTDIAAQSRSSLEGIARGLGLDDSLREIAGSVSTRLGADVCNIWLVKQGDLCRTCANAGPCEDRSMCLHLKVTVPSEIEAPIRVPLVVFRDRAVAKGGSGRVGEPRSASGLLFAQSGANGGSDQSFAALPLRGPSGVIGLVGVVRPSPLSLDEMESLAGLADEAVVAIRIADLTSRYQRAVLQLEDATETRFEVEGLLHSILYGSSEYDVIAEDLDGNVTVFSEGARNTYGYTPDELIGKVKADVLYAPEEIESGKIIEILNEAMTTGRCEAVVLRLRKNGDRFPARATFTVRRDAEGDPCGFVIVERDLTVERTSARLSATTVQQLAQLQDHLMSLKSTNALLEDDLHGLRLENDELRGSADKVRELEDINAIREAIIRELQTKLATVASEPRDDREEERVETVVVPDSPPPASSIGMVAYLPSDELANLAATAGEGTKFERWADPRAALAALRSMTGGVVFLDVEATGGWVLLAESARSSGAIRAVAYGAERHRGRALQIGAWSFLPRPASTSDAWETLERTRDGRKIHVGLVAGESIELDAALSHDSFVVDRFDNWRVARDRMLRGDFDALVLDAEDHRLRCAEMLDWLAGEPSYLTYPIVLLFGDERDPLSLQFRGARPASVLRIRQATREMLLGAVDGVVVR